MSKYAGPNKFFLKCKFDFPLTKTHLMTLTGWLTLTHVKEEAHQNKPISSCFQDHNETAWKAGSTGHFQ